MIRNHQSLPLKDTPSHPIEEWRKKIIEKTKEGLRISALFAQENKLMAILAHDEKGTLLPLSTEVPTKKYPSLTPECPQAHLFEREIKEQHDILPEGHPWLKPVRALGTDFFRIAGEEIHEVAVGPVHAGIIEPGHFRFQCHGEDVIHLEIALGYQHRGLEHQLQHGPTKRTLSYMETAAGDTSIGHTLAYCHALETLSSCEVSERAQMLRAIGLELERLANHTGDLGALAADIGYLPTSSYCGRLRGEFLNLTAEICGSRLGRGLVRPGGVGFDIDEKLISLILQEKLKKAFKDVTDAVQLLWDTPSVLSRFEETGVLSKKSAMELGMVGLVARSSGLRQDIRHTFPFGIYHKEKPSLSTWKSGDVFARAHIRWLEIQASVKFILKLLEALPAGKKREKTGALLKNTLTVSLIEGWRGEICHVAITDDKGLFSTYKIVDPSFHNWAGLALALRGQQISDFPLCNKSFNLSYCGHDL
ncbi:MAG: NADH-quinone oxidoreductase subunit C [Deltaproteobacteria bacterium]|nr:NADH-quinone oxidoreductase subunit C [Deltaproteobacteria bacterium]